MKYLQYQGPSDTFDATNIVGKAGYVWNTRSNSAVPADQRGNVIAVTNEIADELRTYPGHTFNEVDETLAKELTVKQDAVKKQREAQLAFFAAEPANAGLNLVAPEIVQSQIDSLNASTPVIAAAAPSSAAQIKSEVKSATPTVKE